MTDTTNKHNRNVLEHLILFNEKGYNIPLELIYTIEWEIIPHPLVSHLFTENIKGHIAFNLINLYGLTITIDPKEDIVIDKQGRFMIDEVTIRFSNGETLTIGVKPDNYITSYSEDESTKGTVIVDDEKVLTGTKDICLFDVSKPIRRDSSYFNVEPIYETERYYNTCRITINTLEQQYIKEYPASYIFSDINKPNVKQNFYSTNNDGIRDKYATIEYFEISEITLLTPTPESSEHNNILEALINTNFKGNIKALYPGVLYQGCVWQDKVSTDFIAANTLMLFNTLLFGGEKLLRPSFTLEINDDETKQIDFLLYFKFQKGSEMRFIASDLNYSEFIDDSGKVNTEVHKDSISNLIWTDLCIPENIKPIITVDEQGHELEDENNDNPPICIPVGFLSEIEGCYLNIMAIYIRATWNDINDVPVYQDFLLGLITFFTEVEGEDERYRALLGNFGIPDPAKYANVFKDSDPDEQGVDWILVNQKSKELMISYDNIFPYVGTYKALLNAVRFLGYWDLIFKEWYRIKDASGRDKYVTLQAYDFVKGESLQTKLKKTNVTFGEFEKYKKINRLTMIYHLNQLDDETGEYVNYYLGKDSAIRSKKTVDGKEIFTWVKTNTGDGQFYQLPITYKVYQYRTEEIFAKLFSVKRWLEKYILGVNCYISDICGEGIVLERLKTLAYSTEHYVLDFTTEGKFTPKIVKYGLERDGEFKEGLFDESKTELQCTLNEFTNLTLQDYEDWTIEKFVVNELTNGDNTIYVSPPFETLVPATEYQFKAELHEVESGTLAEFTSKTDISTNKNTILIRDNKILFYNNKNIECFIQDDECPLIEVSKANIRYCHGSWKENVCYAVNINNDNFTGNNYYTFTSKDGDIEDFRSNQKIFLVPIPSLTPNNLIFGAAINVDNENYPTGMKSLLVYTANNKWKLPMFIIRNYVLRNTHQVLEGDFILEIIEGRMIFRNKQPETGNDYVETINPSTNEIFFDPSAGRYKAAGAEVKFGTYYDLEAGELTITTNYTYLSNRAPIYKFDSLNMPSDKWDDLEVIDSYTYVNKLMHIPVNRLGRYTVQVNAFDQYNNIFVNNSDDETIVHTNPVPLDIVLNQEYMKNEKTFSDRNGYGDKILDSNYIDTLLNISIPKLSGQPFHPLNWRIYDIDPVLDSSNIIKYDSISYAMEVPYTGNFILFNNFTEKVVSVTKTGSTYKLGLLDENPNPDTIRNASYVGICVYDNKKKDIISDICPVELVGPNEFFDASKDSPYSYNKSYITVKDNPEIYMDNGTVINDISLGYLATSHIIESSTYLTAYVYSATEIIPADISVNLKEGYSLITESNSNGPKFVEGQVIKICYSDDRDIHNHYTKNTIDNESVYRISKIEQIDSSVIYTLAGIVDVLKLNNKLYHNKAEHIRQDCSIAPVVTDSSYIIKMCPAHLNAAQYTLRVSNVGEETLVYYNGTEMNEMTVLYEYMPLLFNEYLDTTYSAAVYSYDPYMLDNVFVYDVSTIFNKDDDLYIYKDFPVTVEKGRTMILYPDDTDTTLTTKFMTVTNDIEIPWRVDWNWNSYIIDDLRNCPNLYLDLVNKQTIFKSTNPILPVKADLLGTQSPEMWVTDIFGNKLVNYADGFVYVNENEDIIYNRQEQGTRPIYYKDVYIIGLHMTANVPHTMSADGETTTFGYNSTGADGDNNQVNVLYTIYYNDGTLLLNEGATVQLLSNSGKKARSNKVKISLEESIYAHKHVNAEINGYIEFDLVNERDLIKGPQEFTADVYQYGYSKTTNIYDFSFTVKDIPAEGLETLEHYIVQEYITDIRYTMTRSEGEVETVTADSLNIANLKIVNLQYIDKKHGVMDFIYENDANQRKYIGTLMLTVDFYVNGVNTVIRTQASSNVYQEKRLDF